MDVKMPKPWIRKTVVQALNLWPLNYVKLPPWYLDYFHETTAKALDSRCYLSLGVVAFFVAIKCREVFVRASI